MVFFLGTKLSDLNASELSPPDPSCKFLKLWYLNSAEVLGCKRGPALKYLVLPGYKMTGGLVVWLPGTHYAIEYSEKHIPSI